MRIVHLSDIHAFVRPRSWLMPDKRLLGTFNYLLRRRHHFDWSRIARAVARTRLLTPDLVVITGDISTVSNPAEFDMALEALQPLVDDHSFDLVFVPGNHDHYVRRGECLEALRRATRVLNRERWGLEDLPRIHDVGRLRLLLLNTVRPVAPWSSHGALAAADQTWLREHLERNDFRGNRRVALVQHFPLYDRYGNELSHRRRCRDADVMQRAFMEGKIDLSFCGHIHTPYMRWEEGGSVELCGGSVTLSGLFNQIEYDLQANRLAHAWINVDLDTPAVTPASPQALMEALEETGAASPLD